MIDKNGKLLFKVFIYENWLDKPGAQNNNPVWGGNPAYKPKRPYYYVEDKLFGSQLSGYKYKYFVMLAHIDGQDYVVG